MKKYDIVIVGAGASGLMCAARLSDFNLNKKILLIDHMDKIGKKILATGNGRCNISNKNISKANYYSNNREFLNVLMPSLKDNIILNYFEELGLKTKTINDGYYPITEQASSVLDVLRLRITDNRNIEILTETEVKEITKDNNYKIKTNNEEIESDIVVLATGGRAGNIYGSDGAGYRLLEKLGHTKTDIYKGLVQLTSDNKGLKYLKGLRSESIVKILVNYDLKKTEEGEVQFTEYGLSGICVFNLSHIASYHKDIKKDNVVIALDLMPNMTEEELKRELINRKNKYSNRIIDYYLTGLLNNKLAYAIYKDLNIDCERFIDTLTEKDIYDIGFKIKNYTFNITGTKNFENAQVTAGGINTKEINPNTFESNLKGDLYIIGELLDIHGDCGGYNLNFAFTSGYIAANNIANK